MLSTIVTNFNGYVGSFSSLRKSGAFAREDNYGGLFVLLH